jgi:hypothetical protein
MNSRLRGNDEQKFAKMADNKLGELLVEKNLDIQTPSVVVYV